MKRSNPCTLTIIAPNNFVAELHSADKIRATKTLLSRPVPVSVPVVHLSSLW